MTTFAATTSPTPFGMFDSDTDFSSEADQMVTFVKRKLGDDVLSVELTKKQIWGNMEEASLEYSSILNQYQAKSQLVNFLGFATGSMSGAEEKYVRLTKPFSGPVEQTAKFKLIEAMYTDLKTNVIKKSTEYNFTDKAFSFLKRSIFGSDLANVIDITSTGVKEITVEYFDALVKTTKLVAEAKGNNLVFKDKSNNIPIFQIRTKLRPPPANEAKFYLEVGKRIYAK